MAPGRALATAGLLLALCLAQGDDTPDMIPVPIAFPEVSQLANDDFWRHTPSLPQRVHDQWFPSHGQAPQAAQTPLAPRGVRNLALHQPVTASDGEPVIGELAMITDGDKAALSGSFVEFAPGSQWVQVDMARQAEIWAIALWHFHSPLPRTYRAVVVQVADDAAFTANVRTLFNNDGANVHGLGAGKDLPYSETSRGLVVPAGGIRGRCVRCWSRGNSANDLNHYVEVEIWAR